jgi:hypothetical protein
MRKPFLGCVKRFTWNFAAVLALAILALLSPGSHSSAQAQGVTPPGLERAQAAKAVHAAELLTVDGVVGVGVGLGAGGEAVIIVTTARPGVTGIPRSLDGVPVRVLVTGPIFANPKPNCEEDPSHPSCKDGGGGGGGDTVDPTAKFARPVPIGVSTGSEASCSAGTIGARVRSGSSVFALSNNHVYAEENDAAIGDPGLDDTPSDTVFQPGRYDTNCVPDGDPLGVLYNFVDIEFSTSASNTVDAAIALTDPDRLGNGTPADGYGVPSSATVAPTLNLAVQKYGRTTGLTRGSIIILDWEGNIGYSSGNAKFVDQIVVYSAKGPFVKAGDSGSLVVTDSGAANPVGLLFAGDASGKYGIVNPIDAVLGALGVSIDGQ